MAATKPTRQFSIFDLFRVSLMFLCGFAGLKLAQGHSGAWQLAAFVSGFISVPLLLWLIFTVLDRRNALPRCRNDRCRTSQYRLERRAEEGDYYLCACGDLYVLIAGDEFRIVNKDGVSEPHKKRHYAGGPWRPANEEPR